MASSPADLAADQRGALGGREGPAREGQAGGARALAAGRGPARPAGPDRGGPRGPAPAAGPGAGRADGGLAVRVPARLGRADGRGLRPPAPDRGRAGHLRGRPPGQLRLLRLARAGPGLRPQRLRRGPPRALGVGPVPAHHQRLGGRAPERPVRGHLRGRGPALRLRLPAPAARSWPASRCWRGPSTASTSTGCGPSWPTGRCGARSSGRPSGPGPGPATGPCPS